MKPDRLLMPRVVSYAVMFSISIAVSSCKKFVEVDPPKTQISGGTVFQSDGTAIAAMNGIYSRMMSDNGFASGAIGSVTFLAGLSSDELTNYSNNVFQTEFYSNAITTTNGNLKNYLWTIPYQYINAANAIIEGLSASGNVSDVVKQQLVGEAKFVRAFCHFYLVNLFGSVPLILTTDYRSNAGASRSGVDVVYNSIITDLKDATTLLSTEYVGLDLKTITQERVRPTKWAARALLARTYLYTKDWANAESNASMVIANSSRFSLAANSNAVFLKNSTEAIWQLMPVVPGNNTNEGLNFILTSAPNPSSGVALSSVLVNSFESGDSRRMNWTRDTIIASKTYSYAYKYKVKTASSLIEYSTVLRLAELYFIRAEALVHQNNLTGALADLNTIRNRAGLSNLLSSLNSSQVMDAIEQERRSELFTEWGHRWLDIKRTGRVDQVMSAVALVKGNVWSPHWQLYPIPQSEIQNNPNLKQNPGY
jgi:hypothetical protein